MVGLCFFQLSCDYDTSLPFSVCETCPPHKQLRLATGENEWDRRTLPHWLTAFWRWGVFPDRNSSLWTFDGLTGQVRRDLSRTHCPSSQVVVFKTVGFLCNLFRWGLWSPVNDLSVLCLKPNKKSLHVSAEVIKTRLVSEALSITQRIECLLYEAKGGDPGISRSQHGLCQHGTYMLEE